VSREDYLPNTAANCNSTTVTVSGVFTAWLSLCSDWLRVARSGDRNLVGVRFSVTVQIGSGAHPASLYNGYRVFPGLKRS